MTNNEITKEWIAQQRAVCKAIRTGTILNWHINERLKNSKTQMKRVEARLFINGQESHSTLIFKPDADFIENALDGYLPALDALEASMQGEAEKDATIARLTAERDAEKRRADAAVDDIAKVCHTCKHRFDLVPTGEPYPQQCNGCNGDKWEWRGPVAANTDAPTGAESEGHR